MLQRGARRPAPPSSIGPLRQGFGRVKRSSFAQSETVFPSTSTPSSSSSSQWTVEESGHAIAAAPRQQRTAAATTKLRTPGHGEQATQKQLLKRDNGHRVNQLDFAQHEMLEPYVDGYEPYEELVVEESVVTEHPANHGGEWLKSEDGAAQTPAHNFPHQLRRLPPQEVVDEAPPQLEPQVENPAQRAQENDQEDGELVRVQSPGGTKQIVRMYAVGQDHPPAAKRPHHHHHHHEPQQMIDVYVDETGMVVHEAPTSSATVQTTETERTQPHHVIRMEGASSTSGYPEVQQQQMVDMRYVQFSFYDVDTVGCALCGELVPYAQLFDDHVPNMHPELLDAIVTTVSDVGQDGEPAQDGGEEPEVPYLEFLREQLEQERHDVATGLVRPQFGSGALNHVYKYSTRTRPLRKCTSIRVNPVDMSVAELESALKKKMLEKLGRRMPFSLIDRQHVRCDICKSVVSLNKKFEVVHLVRHFNAWHPRSHRCAGTWPDEAISRQQQASPDEAVYMLKPFSAHDFIFTDHSLDAAEGLQCVWCGMCMNAGVVAVHFHEIHPDRIEVPKCHLCLKEVVLNSRLTERYGSNFGVVMPDEHRYKSTVLNIQATTEAQLETAISQRLRSTKKKANNDADDVNVEDDDELVDLPPADDAMTAPSTQIKKEPATAQESSRRPDDVEGREVEDDEEGVDVEEDEDGGGGGGGGGGEQSTSAAEGGSTLKGNSRAELGRRNRPKRHFVNPALRQANPKDNNRFVEAVGPCEWRCRLCNGMIYAAVISAGAIRHFRTEHPDVAESFQLEISKTRLERISRGCMEFLNATVIECLLCSLTYALHKPYNMCRAIRHLKAKHAEMMPESGVPENSTLVRDNERRIAHIHELRRREHEELMRHRQQQQQLATGPSTSAAQEAVAEHEPDQHHEQTYGSAYDSSRPQEGVPFGAMIERPGGFDNHELLEDYRDRFGLVGASRCIEVAFTSTCTLDILAADDELIDTLAVATRARRISIDANNESDILVDDAGFVHYFQLNIDTEGMIRRVVASRLVSIASNLYQEVIEGEEEEVLEELDEIVEDDGRNVIVVPIDRA